MKTLIIIFLSFTVSDETQAQQSKVVEGVRVSAWLDAPDFLVYDQVSFVFMLENVSGHSVSVPEYSTGGLEWNLHKQGAELPCLTASNLIIGEECVTLGPGERYYDTRTLICGSPLRNVPGRQLESGSYEIRISIFANCESKSLPLSIILPFSVHEPSSTERTILDHLISSQERLLPAGQYKEYVNELRELWKKHKDSRYGPRIYQNLSASRGFLVGIPDFETINVEAADRFSEKAISKTIVQDRFEILVHKKKIAPGKVLQNSLGGEDAQLLRQEIADSLRSIHPKSLLEMFAKEEVNRRKRHY